jgi:hypothetical protein
LSNFLAVEGAIKDDEKKRTEKKNNNNKKKISSFSERGLRQRVHYEKKSTYIHMNKVWVWVGGWKGAKEGGRE